MSQPTSLAARLGAVLLQPAKEVGDSDPRVTLDRLLDAAARRFAAVGIRSATMSSIAVEAGVSREWLYRNFPNKSSVLDALVQRELRRFIDGLATSVDWGREAATMLTDAFVYCVEFFRDLPAIEGIFDRDVTLGLNQIRVGANEIVGVGVRGCAEYLVALGGFDVDRAAVISESLVRLVGSTLVAPSAGLDLHDAAVLRRYAARVVPAIVNGA